MHILDTERLSLREFTPLAAPFLLRLVNEDGVLVGMCGLFRRPTLL